MASCIRPVPSGCPIIMFRFCMACPAAPLTRLSSTARQDNLRGDRTAPCILWSQTTQQQLHVFIAIGTKRYHAPIAKSVMRVHVASPTAPCKSWLQTTLQQLRHIVGNRNKEVHGPSANSSMSVHIKDTVLYTTETSFSLRQWHGILHRTCTTHACSKVVATCTPVDFDKVYLQ